MDALDLIVDLHCDGPRQGPGGDAETRRAIAMTGLEGARGLRIADVGCGTGAATRVLARDLDAHLTAVDLLPRFLEKLDAEAARDGLERRIATCAASMDALPFGNDAFDAIWSEGAAYNIGFRAAVRQWRRYLRPGGILAVSELIWLTADRPEPLQAHWDAAYPEVDVASAKIAVLEAERFAPLGYFVLPETCWRDGYYRPLQARFPAFLDRHGHSDAARAIVAEEEAEIALYERYSEFFGYGYFVARRVGP